MAQDDILLIALGAAVLLGGLSFGKIGEGVVKPLSDPIRDLTRPAGSAIADPIGWIIPDSIEAWWDRSVWR